MAPTEQAQRNHEDLFPGHVSTLRVTDPELIEYFDNFAFDDVLRHSDLSPRTRLMVQLAALIAGGALGEYRAMLGAALTVGVTPVEVKEIVYQAVPYAGIGRVFDFLHATNEILTARGVTLPLDGQSTTTPETRREKGLAVQKHIVGAEQVDAMYAGAPVDEAHIQEFLSANCFGDHYTRGGIDIPTRELLTFAMLVALGGCDPQVKGHVAANRHVGNSRSVLLDVATQLLPFIGYPRTLNAIRAIDEIIPPETGTAAKEPTLTTWTEDDLTTLGQAEELQVTSPRPDGTPRPYVTIWVVRAGEGIYIRSAHGSTNPWFRRAKAAGRGRIRTGGLECDVTFADAAAGANSDIDRAYHAKYDRYGPAIVGSVVGAQAAAVTIQLLPR